MWTEIEPVGRLLAAGADDYVTLDVETRELERRLHIFFRQSALRRMMEDRTTLDDRLVREHRLETLASLTGGLAHDYNNLLSAIQGNAELALMDMTLDAPVRYSLEQINSAAQRAAEITRQVLAFRGSGAAAKGPQALNLSQLIGDISELLRIAIARKCRIEYRLSRTLPLVTGDPLRVRQLVMAGVSSASGALGRQGGLIEIRTSQGDGGDPGQVVLEVRHSSEEGASGAVGARTSGGDGDSALAAAQLIAREQGAELKCASDGSGGTFRVRFVATGGQTPDQAPRPTRGEHGQPAGTILLIDDDEAVRAAAHRFLRRAGYTVFEAASCEEGLAVTSQIAAALDTILVGMNMPGMECRELLQQLRGLRREIRLVVWSGLPEEAAREGLGGLADVAFLEKPAQLGELAGALQRALQS
jgi:DNA-binding response OmpR family regulator